MSHMLLVCPERDELEKQIEATIDLIGEASDRLYDLTSDDERLKLEMEYDLEAVKLGHPDGLLTASQEFASMLRVRSRCGHTDAIEAPQCACAAL
jgi:hypothetical protein